jgi:zinc protease
MHGPLADSHPDDWFGRPEARVLANGLTVALLGNDSAPVVSTALWYRAGTAHEPADQEGVAHFLEHMMFKGSSRFATGEVDRLTQATGGSNNAYTSHDSTVYVFSFPAGAWRTALEIEADRLASPTLDPAEVAAEREVILEEVAEVDDDPWGRLETAVHEAFFGDHPYGRRILGRRASLEGIQERELAEFHRLAYRPGQAVLTVAGAVGEEVFAAAGELFGDLPGRSEAPALEAPRAPRALARVEVAKGDTRRGLWALPSPAAAERDFVCLRLALTAIGGSRSSRLQRVLVDEGRLCGSVSTAMMETVRPGAATLAVEMLPGVEPARVEDIVQAELERARSGGIEPGDVERARRLLLSDWLFSHETIEQRGLTWGAALALFGGDYVANHHRWLAAATVDEVTDAARRFLDLEHGGVIGWAGV